jgi:hypothetical protein
MNKDNNFLKEKHPNNISTHSDKSINEKLKNQNKMKDKIKNFVFEIEEKSGKANNHSAKEMPRQIQTKENIKYDFSTTKNLNNLNDYNSYNGNKEYKPKNNSCSTNLNISNGNYLRSPKAREEKNNFFNNYKDKGKNYIL